MMKFRTSSVATLRISAVWQIGRFLFRFDQRKIGVDNGGGGDPWSVPCVAICLISGSEPDHSWLTRRGHTLSQSSEEERFSASSKETNFYGHFFLGGHCNENWGVRILYFVNQKVWFVVWSSKLLLCCPIELFAAVCGTQQGLVGGAILRGSVNVVGLPPFPLLRAPFPHLLSPASHGSISPA